MIEQRSDALPDGFDGPFLGFSQQRFEFGEDLFDRVEVRRIGRQEDEPGTSSTDQTAHLAAFVRTKIVHHHNISGRQCWGEHLLDIDREGFAIDRSVEHKRRRDPVMPKRGKERHRAPVTVRNLAHKRLATALPATRPCHIGLGPGFIDEDETRWINPVLIFFPADAAARDVGPVLLDGEHGFF